MQYAPDIFLIVFNKNEFIICYKAFQKERFSDKWNALMYKH